MRAAAAQVALLVAQHRYDLRRTLTFHPASPQRTSSPKHSTRPRP
ncbi:hypothetical protein ACFQV4_30690 [Streptomyces thermocarboxydus]